MSKAQDFWDNVVMARSREWESQPETFRRQANNLAKFNADMSNLSADFNRIKQQETSDTGSGLFNGSGKDAKDEFLGQIKG